MMYVFVYGTLLSGEPNSSLLYETNTIRPGTIAGRMVTLGPFPAICLAEELVMNDDESGVVRGEIVEISDDIASATLARLDRLEGYRGPDGNNFYERSQATVISDDGDEIKAWVYSFSYDTWKVYEQRGQEVRSGSWRDRLYKD